ncbi:hypothetical protein VTN00DRAFT_7469 [Thermoascus crustaceus]
MALNFEKNL